MSVLVTYFVGPRPDESLNQKEFVSFISDLIQNNILIKPWAILGGKIDPAAMGLSNQASALMGDYASPEDKAAVKLLSSGDDLLIVEEKLNESYGDNENIGVSFHDGLNWDNEELSKSFENVKCYNGCVGIYSFAKPQQIKLSNAYDDDTSDHEITIKQYFSIEGESTMYELFESPLKDLIIKHFGEILVTGTCMG